MNKIIEKEKIHNGDIWRCTELNDGTIASGDRPNNNNLNSKFIIIF